MGRGSTVGGGPRQITALDDIDTGVVKMVGTYVSFRLLIVRASCEITTTRISFMIFTCGVFGSL
jgi:hypothetical protein